MNQAHDGKNALIKNSIYYTLGTFFYFFCQWLTTMLVVRLAGYEQAGIFSIAISFSNIFYFIAMFGIRNYQISDVEERFSDAQYLGARMMAAVLSALAFSVGILVSSFSDEATLCCILYMLFKLAEVSTDYQFAIMQKHDEYLAIFLSYTAKGVIPILGFTVGLYVFANLNVAIVLMLSLYVATMGYDLWIRSKWGRTHWNFQGSWEILKRCVPLMISSLIPPFMNFVVRYSIQRYRGEEELGFYSSFAAIIVIMTTLAGAMWNVILPKISEDLQMQRNCEAKRFLYKVFVGILVVGVLVVAFGRGFGPWALSLLYGQEILLHEELLIPVLTASVVLTASSFLSVMAVPLHRYMSALFCNIAGALFCTIATPILTWYSGAIGANLSYIFGLLLQTVLLLIVVFAPSRKQPDRA